jgi:ribose transport system substrate-binding protein
LAGELAKSMGNKGVVAILAGNQNAPNLQARVRGVREGMKAFKDIQILDTYYHAETPQDAVLKVEQVMAANPQITGWAMVGGWPLFTQNALKSVAGRAKVVAVDTLLAQQVYEWGTTSVQLIMEKLVENKQPASPIVNAPLVVVNKANVDEYGKNWDRWLGKSK